MIRRFGSEPLARCHRGEEHGGPGRGRRRRSCVFHPLLAIAAAIFLPNFVLSGPVYPRGTTSDSFRGRNFTSLSDVGEHGDNDLPVFEPTAPAVSALEGQTVYLPCRVRNLGDKVVSWIRIRDLHILTSADVAFSSDARFAPQHAPGSDAWTLRIDNARRSDSGRYECQVNTEPKMMYAVQLAVRDPDKPEGHDEPSSQQTRIRPSGYESTAPLAAIMGPREQRVSSGSTITLRCVVTSPYQTRPVRGVQWLRDNKLLTFQAARGGIIVETEKGAAQTVSELTLAGVTPADGARYSCRPTEGRADTILLVVDEGERTEAMHRDGMRHDDMQRDASFAASGSRGTRMSDWLFINIVAWLTISINVKTS
ncbi:uncharacterized protein LOC124185055 isoform X1 [Neodiprion fabricii]|uniref:uncharacterized protein LOC124185055 isoform X1 n=1 Tax=Neodiprion fabricii TaxID=2872261 RepID=UPI001ED8E997|nr:uncharacterized protein LOC124185055 isoform X1 [Neodiprion fabricii]XP_046431345.1 uncharacterized protein LOC124185055 isoform X1 [Neodiprion fabricii]XP_046431346.1 uncharacterized protein LOC124185055 isoform X1 [Neodiprion fabricii]XP_046431347.1 uncharacterized protein LOC124185055 isoform X1 [Neodiprion fabricii]XP_046431348.1 uncharacterized protein LOC124185055 isoform X1 [Neodiprion fabricii]XP_046431349.1 uncharacterized protein LOC124185055 isoform X1 [Neodiprion fabricii]XP_04